MESLGGRSWGIRPILGLCLLGTGVRSLASSPWLRVPALGPGWCVLTSKRNSCAMAE